MSRFIAGLGRGQSNNYMVLAILETFGKYQINKRYSIRHLERFKGTPYSDAVNRVLELMNNNPLKGNTTLVVDASYEQTLLDMLNEVKLHPMAITITEDDTIIRELNNYRVPKKKLVTNLQLLFIAERLRVNRDLPMAEIFIKELLSFRVKSSSKTYENKEETYNDLIFAVALACWYGQEVGKKEVRFPNS